MRRSSSSSPPRPNVIMMVSMMMALLLLLLPRHQHHTVVDGFQQPTGAAGLRLPTVKPLLFQPLEDIRSSNSGRRSVSRCRQRGGGNHHSISKTFLLMTKSDNNDEEVNGFSADTETSGVSETEENNNPIGHYHEPPQESSYDIRRFRCASYLLVQSAAIGLLSGWSVGIFKIFTDTVQHLAYTGTSSTKGRLLRLVWLPIIPALGGLIVSLLRKIGGGFPPGMRDTIKSVDQLSAARKSTTTNRSTSSDSSSSSSSSSDTNQQMTAANKSIFYHFRFLQKSMAAVVTLGTGCSLGPEGPSVEIGMNLSRLTMDIFPIRTNTKGSKQEQRHQRRLLMACGAAAGVSAGFNAPLAGAFFALEIMQQAFDSIDQEQQEETSTTSSTARGGQKNLNNNNDGGGGSPAIAAASGSISAVLLASVTSALVCQSLLGEHLMFALKDYTMKTPLLELPIYLLLGATSGLAAFLFSQTSTWSRSLFQGRLGPQRIRNRFANLPTMVKPALGGFFCGLVGLVFPQILFSGYDTINIVLANRMLPTTLLLALFGVKMMTTAVAAGSGLVGGTFAPSLFLGGMVGSAFHNIVSWLLENAANHGTITLASPMLQMADLPAYAMVGSATLLAAVFRAPLTASLLLFELTRDYGAILPLMASSGVASVVGDILDVKRETRISNRQSQAGVTSK